MPTARAGAPPGGVLHLEPSSVSHVPLTLGAAAFRGPGAAGATEEPIPGFGLRCTLADQGHGPH